MAINQALLGEFDHEMANTRKTLERVPDGKFDWKPRPEVDEHGATGRAHHHDSAVGQDDAGYAQFRRESSGRADLEAAGAEDSRRDTGVFRQGRARAAGGDCGAPAIRSLMAQWSLLNGGKAIFTMPRVAVMRSMIMNHLIHHRAQLCVYYRLNGVPVPALYGPSADEAN